MKHTSLLTKIALITVLVFALVGCATATPTATNTTSSTGSTSQNTNDTSQTSNDTSSSDTTSNTADTTTNTESGSAQSDNTMIVKLNLNTAAGDDYQALIPDFSSRMVREFLEYRPYVSIQQFRKEIGKYVSDEQVAEWELYVYVPVDVDNSDAETLKQLPGVEDTIATTLMDARPYGSNEAFLEKLAEYVSVENAAGAGDYLTQ